MATSLKNLSSYDPSEIPSAEGMKFGIAVSEWNQEVTFSLLQGCVDVLQKHGAREENITIIHVPGSFELSHGCKLLVDDTDADAVIALGCVIQGETRHFDFICQGVAQGITDLNTQTSTPVIFGVLTTNDQQQALDRAGGKHGNKGDEAAITAIKMVALSKDLKKDQA